MTNFEKMISLAGDDKASKRKVIEWAYMNRITVVDLPQTEPFEEMETSVEDFFVSDEFINNVGDEFKLWEKFLEREFVSQKEAEES